MNIQNAIAVVTEQEARIFQGALENDVALQGVKDRVAVVEDGRIHLYEMQQHHLRLIRECLEQIRGAPVSIAPYPLHSNLRTVPFPPENA